MSLPDNFALALVKSLVERVKTVLVQLEEKLIISTFSLKESQSCQPSHDGDFLDSLGCS